MKISEIKGNLISWKEQRDALLKKLERLDKRTEELENKLNKYEKENGM